MDDSSNTFKSTQPMLKDTYGVCSSCKKKFEIRAPKTEEETSPKTPPNPSIPKFSKIKSLFHK